MESKCLTTFKGLLLIFLWAVPKIDGRIIISNWLEVGHMNINSNDYSLITTELSTFSKPHVFTSIPIHGTSAYDSGYQSCSRIKDITTNSNGATSFKVKIVQPNDSWCNFTWWTPQMIQSQTMSYLVIEEGHYMLQSAEFDVNAGQFEGHCSYYFHRHMWFTKFASTSVRPGSIAQHQTADDPRFVSFREVDSNNNANGVTLYIQLHNAYSKFQPHLGDCINGHYGDHYDSNKFRQAYTIAPAKVSVLGYTVDNAMSCTGGIVLEAQQLDSVTSNAQWIHYYWKYSRLPSVFGMVNSFLGHNSITVRGFNGTHTGIGVSPQEDLCDKPTAMHVLGEKMSFIIIGTSLHNTVVQSAFPSAVHTVYESVCEGKVVHTENEEMNIDMASSSASSSSSSSSMSLELRKDSIYSDKNKMEDGKVKEGEEESQRICINFMLLDKFGDGWSGVSLFLYDNGGAVEALSPSCNRNPVYAQYCFDDSIHVSGDYINVLVNGYSATWTSEILWQAYVPSTPTTTSGTSGTSAISNGGDGKLYTGTYTTGMKFVYEQKETSSYVRLSSSTMNLHSNALHCESGVESEGRDLKEIVINNEIVEIKETTTTTNTIEDQTMSIVHTDSVHTTRSLSAADISLSHLKKQALLRGRSLLRNSLFEVDKDSIDTSVFIPYGISPYHEISTNGGYELIYGSNICHNIGGGGGSGSGGGSGVTNYVIRIDEHMADKGIQLPSGCYQYRMGGDAFSPTSSTSTTTTTSPSSSSSIAWEFCGMKGGMYWELSFCINEAGQCQPGVLRDIKEICTTATASDNSGNDGLQSSPLVLAGSLVIRGLRTVIPSDGDKLAVGEALNSEMSHAALYTTAEGVAAVRIIGWDAVHDDAAGKDKNPSDTDRDAAVRISFRTQIHGEHFNVRGTAGDDMRKLSAGLKSFLTRSMSTGVFVAKVIRQAHIHNAHNLKEIDFAKLIYVDILHEQHINEELSIAANIIVTISIFMSVVFGLGFFIYYYTQNKRNGHDLLPSEDDYSNGHMMSTSDVDVDGGDMMGGMGGGGRGRSVLEMTSMGYKPLDK